jgi:cysteine synthase
MNSPAPHPSPYSPDDPVLEMIGDTPLVSFPSPEYDNVQCKLEHKNPTGSMKDRVALGILLEECAGGDYDTVVEASSGNTAGSIALVANRLGLDCHVTCPESTSRQKKGYMRSYGAEVHECPSVSEGEDGYYHTVARELAAELDALFVDQYHNQANPRVHYNWTGPEIWSQTCGELTHLVSPMGTGGTLSGCARYLKEQAEAEGTDVTIVGVDAEQSNISTAFNGEDEIPYDTAVEGLGKGHELPTMWFDYIDEVRDVSDENAFETARWSARENGLLIGQSSGAALSVAKDISERHPDATIVTMVCDSGDQYFDTLFGCE